MTRQRAGPGFGEELGLDDDYDEPLATLSLLGCVSISF